MSEITRGLIGMPYDMAMESELSRRQFHGRAQELLTENERLNASEQEATELCDCLSVLLGEVAVVVRGPEEPKTRHGFHDLPSRVKMVVAERDHLKAENAGLKTGYEAYDQVVQGLRAENEMLREALELSKGTREIEAQSHELRAEIIEKQEEQIELLKSKIEVMSNLIDAMLPFKGAPRTGPDTKCLACGGYYGLHGLPCPNMRVTAQAELPDTRSGQIGGATSKETSHG